MKNKNRLIGVDQDTCPLCFKRAVSKINRRCMDCGRRLCWDGDDCKELLAEGIQPWYFHVNVYGTMGWHDFSYFVQEQNHNTMLAVLKKNNITDIIEDE